MAKDVTMPLSEYQSDLDKKYLEGRQDALSAAFSAFHNLIIYGRSDELSRIFEKGEFISNDKARYTPKYFEEWMDSRLKDVVKANVNRL